MQGCQCCPEHGWRISRERAHTNSGIWQNSCPTTEKNKWVGPSRDRLGPTRIDSVLNARFVQYGCHARQYRFLYDKLCNLALYSLNAKKFCLADAMIAAAVDEIDRDCRLMFSIWAKQRPIPSISASDSSKSQFHIYFRSFRSYFLSVFHDEDTFPHTQIPHWFTLPYDIHQVIPLIPVHIGIDFRYNFEELVFNF